MNALDNLEARRYIDRYSISSTSLVNRIVSNKGCDIHFDESLTRLHHCIKRSSSSYANSVKNICVSTLF